MARTTQVVIVDDIDGGPADETVTFALDGVTYEIDLSRANAAKMRKAFAPFVSQGRRTGGRLTRGAAAPASAAAAKRKSRKTRSSAGRDIPAIRAWARDQGLVKADRGRIPASVLAAYDAAH